MVNHGESTRSETLHFKDVPGVSCGDQQNGCHVVDIWKRKDLGVMDQLFKADISSRDTVFLALHAGNTSCPSIFRGF
jgi:hypothetical protein